MIKVIRAVVAWLNKDLLAEYNRINREMGWDHR